MNLEERLAAVEELIGTVEMAIRESRSCAATDVGIAKPALVEALGSLQAVKWSLEERVVEAETRERRLAEREYAAMCC